MYQLVESARIENRLLHNIELHNQRLNRATRHLFGIEKKIYLEDFIDIPANLTEDRYKCRVTVSPEKINVNIAPYIQREIKSLRIVHDNEIDFSFKTENRLRLDTLYEKRNGCDDVIIIKNGYVTDSWAANILLFDGQEWFTPDTPLLKGIQREYLLLQNKVKEKKVMVSDLHYFQKIRLINAMIDFERAPIIDIPSGLSFG